MKGMNHVRYVLQYRQERHKEVGGDHSRARGVFLEDVCMALQNDFFLRGNTLGEGEPVYHIEGLPVEKMSFIGVRKDSFF